MLQCEKTEAVVPLLSEDDEVLTKAEEKAAVREAMEESHFLGRLPLEVSYSSIT